MPRRVSSAQASSAESCWLHDVRTLATRDLSNETSRERFTCVVAYSFVWRDSRTSVAHPLARPSDRLRRGSLRKAFALRLLHGHYSPRIQMERPLPRPAQDSNAFHSSRHGRPRRLGNPCAVGIATSCASACTPRVSSPIRISS